MEKEKPQSIGEELFLVHLRRHEGLEPREEDFDHEAPRKPHHTLGEELWDVHLKRSQGMAPDYDREEDYNASNQAAHVQQQAPKKECPYGLRSKDRPKK